MQRSSVRELAAAMRPQYQQASKRERGRLLDVFCAATGYHRVYARTLLRQGPSVIPRPRPAGRVRLYGAAEVALLRACWEIADRICGKRLAPYLPELLDHLATWDALPEALSAGVVARVRGLSAATIDRWLASERDTWSGRGRATTKPGTRLKQQIPIRTFAPWDDAGPGFLEMDLVAHCGASGAGEFLFTVSAVDVSTGWMRLVGVRNKSEHAVFAALEQLRTARPFPLLGLACDNGGEFITHNLLRYCTQEHITLTRGRPYHKNDGCHIEQKNWSVVRRLVGYGRCEGVVALGTLNQVLHLGQTDVNFCQPVLKLVAKTHDGPRVQRQYDRAQTPYRRLQAAEVLSRQAAAELAPQYAAVHPSRLKLALEQAQQALYACLPREGLSLRQRSPCEKISL